MRTEPDHPLVEQESGVFVRDVAGVSRYAVLLARRMALSQGDHVYLKTISVCS